MDRRKDADGMGGIPAGDYILGEIETPPGYLTNQMEVEIRETSKLQLITMQEDHIKNCPFSKYEEKDGKKKNVCRMHMRRS